MTFEEILPYFKKGKKIRRHEWLEESDNEAYILLSDRGAKYIYLYADGRLFDDAYNLCGYDIIQDDWELVEEDDLKEVLEK